jgi:hypothetical protein
MLNLEIKCSTLNNLHDVVLKKNSIVVNIFYSILFWISYNEVEFGHSFLTSFLGLLVFVFQPSFVVFCIVSIPFIPLLQLLCFIKALIALLFSPNP